jgi:hypothetical protein
MVVPEARVGVSAVILPPADSVRDEVFDMESEAAPRAPDSIVAVLLMVKAPVTVAVPVTVNAPALLMLKSLPTPKVRLAVRLPPLMLKLLPTSKAAAVRAPALTVRL